jgi:hypothetical protein
LPDPPPLCGPDSPLEGDFSLEAPTRSGLSLWRELDPQSQIRIELIDAEESSLRLNAILDWVETQLAQIQEGAGRYPRIAKLAIAMAVFVPTVGIPTYDFYFGLEKTLALNKEDRRLLNELLERTKKNPEVKAREKKFFKTLERDSSISGAGISEGHKDKPIIIVPADQFAERGGLWAIVDEEQPERITYPIVDVLLVAPTLLPTPRTWRFQAPGLPEFTATMRDKKFLAALEHDHVRERLRVGIEMTIRLEIKEKKLDGVWMVKHGGRSVIEVISPKVD